MDQEERCDRVESSKNSSRIAGNSENSIDGIVYETVIVKNSEENGDLRLQNDGFGLCKHQEMDSAGGTGQASSQNDRSTENSSSLVEGNVVENGKRDMGLVEANEMRGVDGTVGQVDRKGGNSDNSVDGFVVETIIVVNTQGAACVNESNGVLQVNANGIVSSSKALAERMTRKVPGGEDSCIIDINGGVGGRKRFKESWDGERVCRICHLNSEQSFECTDNMSSTAATTDLIQLGCWCKDELGIAHSQCAEAWFKLKGNRMCEICGQTAKNVTGVRDNRFIEDWHDQGSTSGDFISSDRGTGCWRGQPFCNFLMACLVIAFVLPWFFHVNMF